MVREGNSVHIVENFVIVWVDEKFHADDSYDEATEYSRNMLHQIVNSVKLVDTCEKCISFINDKIRNEKIFLIVSSSIGQHLVPRIKDDRRLDSIYIFCQDKSECSQWTTKHQHCKIHGVFTNIANICVQLKEDIKYSHHEIIPIETLGSEVSKVENHLDASFMYSQLLKEILLSTNYDEIQLEEQKTQFMEFCRNQYASNQAELAIIEEFQESYSSSTSIWWYTRECFLYSMLNRALCAQDVEILMRMSFFICDLHHELKRLCVTVHSNQVLTVYRGQGMLSEAFDRLQQNKGGLISFNNFLSTSTCKEVSLAFAEKALKNSDKVAILFEMNIDPSVSSVPFASLDQFSYFKDSEKEILFSMHTVFRINEIMPIDISIPSQFWYVRLTSTNDDDEQLRQLSEHMRTELTSGLASELRTTMNPSWRLGKLLINMGEYDKALAIWEIVLEKAKRDNNLELLQATLYEISEFFVIYRNDFNQAKAHLKAMFAVQSLDGRAVADHMKNEMVNIFSSIHALLMREDHDEHEFRVILAELLTQLATLYHNHHTQPLNPLDYQLIANHYNYIALLQKKAGNLPEAWKNLEHALQLLREHLPAMHPRLAWTYHHMGLVQADMKNQLIALAFLEKGLEIQEKSLQPCHPHLAESYFHLSMVLEQLDRLDEALKYAKKAVKVGQLAFLPIKQMPMKIYQKHAHKLRSIIKSNNELIL